MDLRLPVLLVTLLYAATVGGSGPRDYYVPDTPARQALYESCMNKEGCEDRPTDFLKGTCYLFCFLDQNDNGYLTTEEVLDVWSQMWKGKAVPHSLCVTEITKAKGNFSPPAFQERSCNMMEYLTKNGKGIKTLGDIGSVNGTVPVDLERFTVFEKIYTENLFYKVYGHGSK